MKYFAVFICLLASTYCGARTNPVFPELKAPQHLPEQADPLLSTSWYHKSIGVFNAWETSTGSRDIVLAFIDSGIDYNHPELSQNIYRKASDPIDGVDNDQNGFVDDILGWDFVKNLRLPWDESLHGTFLASLAAGVMNNGFGSAGICPDCSLMSAKFIDEDGFGDTEDAIKGIYYAIQNGARVINLSFAGEGAEPELYHALRAAEAADILVVVAAGNDGENLNNSEVFPARYRLPNMITVAATSRHNKLWADSNYSSRFVHIGAPGVSVTGVWDGKPDNTGEGTSDAAAILSGAAGLVLSVRPELSAVELRQLLLDSADLHSELKQKIRNGAILNVQKAIEAAAAL